MTHTQSPIQTAKDSHNMGWELFAHDADIGVRGYGASLAEAFENAALAMTATMTDPRSVEARTMLKVQCTAPSNDILLYEWLNAIVFEMATKSMLFCRFEVEVSNHHLIGKIFGEPIDVAKHQPAVEVKGATLTELHVGRDHSGRWSAQCVVDV